MDGWQRRNEGIDPGYGHLETCGRARIQGCRYGCNSQYPDRIQTLRRAPMKRSSNRILTTHVGSLIRPPQLLEKVRARESGQAADDMAYKQSLKDSVAEVVLQQAHAGIDVVNDGEFGKSTSWALYALKRVSGFEMRDVNDGANPFARGADRERFKEFYAELESGNDRTWSNVTKQEAVCIAPVTCLL